MGALSVETEAPKAILTAHTRDVDVAFNGCASAVLAQPSVIGDFPMKSYRQTHIGDFYSVEQKDQELTRRLMAEVFILGTSSGRSCSARRHR